MWDEGEKRKKAYLLKESSRLHKSFQSTIVIPVLRLPAHPLELPDTPPNQSWCLRSIFAHWNLLPWHKRWICRSWCSQPMTLPHRVHTTCHWCRCDWQWSELYWFVRIEYVRLRMDHYTVRISQCWNVRHVLATMLEWKNWKKKIKREHRTVFLILFALLRCHWISTLIS